MSNFNPKPAKTKVNFERESVDLKPDWFNMMKWAYLIAVPALLLFSCTASKQSFNPDKKFSPAQLQEDYTLFRNILEESHPSLYWYTPKDSMDYFFTTGYDKIRDSMTESEFKTLLSYVISRIDCGHTAVKSSKKYSKYLDTAKLKTFPLSLKFWGDTMVVTANLNRRDSILKRGVILTSINGYTQKQLRDSLFNYIVTDGYSTCGKYQSLSTGFAFANLYKNVYGSTDSFRIGYIDSNGMETNLKLPTYDFMNDTMSRWGFSLHRPDEKKKKTEPRFVFFASTNLQLDTGLRTAYMALNTFDKGNHLKKFFRQSFKAIKQNRIENLVIDVRSNGGGEAGNSTRLTRYLIDHKFKLADSLYSVNRSSRYDKYIEKSFIYHVLMDFATKKEDDGKYHFGYYERKYFKPKKKNHFNGKVYVLIGGNSFSATTLFAGALKGQKNITLVGEETGGGYYGNTAWVIPDVTLPNTRVRFRLPKFRLIVDRNREKNGRGVMPDVWSTPSVEAISKGIDFKSEKARELIETQVVKKAN